MNEQRALQAGTAPRLRHLTTALGLSTAALLASVSRPAGAAEFLTYFQPTPIYDKLETGIWGAAGVVPREQHNGLEDFTMGSYTYWDGKIIKGPDGKYHLFGSRWDQSTGHAGYYNSVCIHATSDTPTGPYTDKGLCYPSNQGGKGHNVTAIAMHDGRYAILVSDTRPGDLFIATSLDGPWVYQGRIQIDTNGFTTTRLTDNMSIMLRPDGRYMIVPLGGFVMISDSGIIGPYKVVTNNIFPQNVPGYKSATREDPVVWYSGCQYHVLVDDYADRKAMHLTSPDAITWTYKDLAYDPTTDFVRYTNGTINHWYKLERPGVLLENGHVTHFTFAGIDVDKTLDLGGDAHGSKIIVVPFDGAKFDADTGLAGCQSTGTGGAASTGGATSTGGAASGGTTARGGSGGTSAAAGGTSSRGGSTSAGGTSSSVAGGATARGGSTATAAGGASSSGLGGAVAQGGAVAAGGQNASQGGATATASGGALATIGGATASVSLPGLGGAVSGVGGSVGTPTTSPTSAAGNASVGGASSSLAGAAGAAVVQGGDAGEDGGCSCRVASSTPNGTARGLALLGLGFVVTHLRRRRSPRV